MVRAEIIYIYALLISLGFGAYSILQQNGAMITIWFLIALILTIFKERIIRLIMRII